VGLLGWLWVDLVWVWRAGKMKAFGGNDVEGGFLRQSGKYDFQDN
jgi:hypothetical protein